MTQNTGNNNNGALGWEDQIEDDGGFTLLEPGTYNFKVVALERGRHEQTTGKLPSCNKAVLTIKILDGGSEPTIDHNLFLHTSTEAFLSQFFVSIGQKEKGQPLQMNWNAVEGATGKCEVDHHEYNGNTYNQIKTFLEKDQATDNSGGANWSPGKF